MREKMVWKREGERGREEMKRDRGEERRENR